MAASWGAGYMLKRRFAQYSATPISNNLSGQEIAEKMLREHNVIDVSIICVDGQLTDHYNPMDKTVNLSHAVYNGRHMAAAAVAAHECGHAIQHAKSYAFLQLRSRLVPIVNISSNYMQWILLGGVLLINTFPLLLGIGIGLFALTTLFAFVTLPVEFDASNRALNWMSGNRIVTNDEQAMAKNALWWAAMTYVIAALGSLATLLYYISIFTGSRNEE